MARSFPFISAIAASRSRSPSALFLFARASAFSSWARSFIAARSSAVNPGFVVVFFVVFFSAIMEPPCRGSVSAVLQQPEDVAVGVGDGGDQAAATDVARGILHGGTGGGHLGQLRLDVRHVPVGHR